MKNGIRLRWKIYAFIYTLLVLGNFIGLFHPKSDLYVYYHTLVAFSKAFYVFYIMNVASSVFGLLSALLLLLYITKTTFLPRNFWIWVLILRIICDLGDHRYEVSLIKSLLHVNFFYVTLSLVITFALILPSYFVFYKYLSRPKELF